MHRQSVIVVVACVVCAGLSTAVAGYTQVAIDDSVPVAVSVSVDADGTAANVSWTTGYPPDRPSVMWWVASTGWVAPPQPTTVPATAELDPEGNPKYHYFARLTELTPNTDIYAVPTDFHSDQVGQNAFTTMKNVCVFLPPYLNHCLIPTTPHRCSPTAVRRATACALRPRAAQCGARDGLYQESIRPDQSFSTRQWHPRLLRLGTRPCAPCNQCMLHARRTSPYFHC